MMLSDATYRLLIKEGEVAVTPEPADMQFQPCSLDLRLGDSYVRLRRNQFEQDLRENSPVMIIRPGEFMLAATIERVCMPSHIAGVVHGKSTWARRGLMVEAAGLVDPGFDGTITLELKNLSHLPIPLRAGQAICQMSFHLLDTRSVRPYGSRGLRSHYQGQTEAEVARE
jgi:dCTP deaminase